MSTRNTVITSMLTALVTSICVFFVLHYLTSRKVAEKEVIVPQVVGLKPSQAMEVLDFTAADGLMIGRAAQGRPWIFREIRALIASGKRLPEPAIVEVRDIIFAHLDALHRFYGEARGVRTARKHLGWYLAGRPGGEELRRRIVRIEVAGEQLAAVGEYFEEALDKELAA